MFISLAVLVQSLVGDRWIMKAMMGENRIFVGHVVRLHGGSKKLMVIISSLRYHLSVNLKITIRYSTLKLLY